ncbi:MAG: hypothetical protein WCC66_12440 [Rhizobiaceae bacterium]
MTSPRRRIAIIITSIYVLSAVAVLAAFLIAPPDGLANIWIAVWTLPVALAGLALLYWPFGIEFPFVPSSGPLTGYYASHTVYFTLAVLLIAALLFRVIGGRS